MLKFYKTNALKGKRVHTALQISEDGKMWSYMVITHNPQKHFRFKYDPYTGELNHLCSFLDTTIKRSDIHTRLRGNKSIKINEEDMIKINEIIKKALSGNDRTSPRTKRMNNNSRIRTAYIKTKKNI